MIRHAEFSKLRLVDLFPDHGYVRAHYSNDAHERGYDIELLGGLWDLEEIPGVQFFYPEVDGARLGALTAALIFPGIDNTSDQVDRFGDPGQQEDNAVRVLAALDLPFRLHDSLASIQDVLKQRNRGGTPGRTFLAGIQALLKRPTVETTRQAHLQLTCLSFRHLEPDPYQFEVFLHDEEGLLRIQMVREDLSRKNEMSL
jgi:hypothetical protein